MAELNAIKTSLIQGDIEQTEQLIKAALKSGASPKELLDNYLVPAMDEVGRKFQKGEFFFPELLVAGEAMKAGVAILKPLLVNKGIPTVGKFVIGTVKGDIHDIGKNIVILMLEGNGWEVTDLGIDVSSEDFVKAVKEQNYQVLGMSALLTTTIPRLSDTIELLKKAGLRNKVKVMVGGVSVNQAFADNIGADAYGKDAVEAVSKARMLIGK